MTRGLDLCTHMRPSEIAMVAYMVPRAYRMSVKAGLVAALIGAAPALADLKCEEYFPAPSKVTSDVNAAAEAKAKTLGKIAEAQGTLQGQYKKEEEGLVRAFPNADKLAIQLALIRLTCDVVLNNPNVPQQRKEQVLAELTERFGQIDGKKQSVQGPSTPPKSATTLLRPSESHLSKPRNTESLRVWLTSAEWYFAGDPTQPAHISPIGRPDGNGLLLTNHRKEESEGYIDGKDAVRAVKWDKVKQGIVVRERGVILWDNGEYWARTDSLQEAHASDGTVEGAVRDRRRPPAGGRAHALPRRPPLPLPVRASRAAPSPATFCATGRMRLRPQPHRLGDPRSGAALPPHRQLDHAVFMGMGEPLLNLDAVLGGLRAACPAPGDRPPAHTTVSTVGWVPGIERLAAQGPCRSGRAAIAARRRRRAAVAADARQRPLPAGRRARGLPLAAPLRAHAADGLRRVS